MSDKSIFNEKELFVAVSEGSESAFTKLFIHYSHILYPFITRLLNAAELSEEIIQQTFLKLWLHREKLAEIENPRAYIFRIASNECFSHLRKKVLGEKMASAIKLAATKEPVNITQEHLTACEIMQLVHEAVKRLPPQQKRIYNLSRGELLKISEIAQLLNLSPLTIKNSLVKSLKSIREHLKNAEYYLPIILLHIFL